MRDRFMDDYLMTVEEVSEFLKVSVQTVRKLIKEKKIAVVKFGKTFRITRGELIKFIRSNLTN